MNLTASFLAGSAAEVIDTRRVIRSPAIRGCRHSGCRVPRFEVGETAVGLGEAVIESSDGAAPHGRNQTMDVGHGRCHDAAIGDVVPAGESNSR
jgi:hypothetical protein